MNKNDKTVKELIVSYPVKVSKSDIDSIMDLALNGGINYWTSEICGHRQISSDNVLAIRIKQPFEEKEWYLLELNKMLRALHLYLVGDPSLIRVEYDWCRIDLSRIDKEQADCIVQQALFGKVVFE